MNPRTPRLIHQPRSLLALPVILGLCLLAACQADSAGPSSRDMRDTGRQVFGSKSAPRTGAFTPENSSWTIMIAAFNGPDQIREARSALAVVQSLGFHEAFAEPREKTTIVALGQYPQPGDPRAQEDLARIREFVVDGSRPYARAMLVPPAAGAQGEMSALDLRTAKEKYGRRAVFTLQIGVYARPDNAEPTPDDLAKFRAAAEEAAARLRQSGEEAFFYHGPFKSMVTVGVFDYSDSDRGAGKPESPRLTDTRKRHPYNLLNGAPYRAKRSGAPVSGKADEYVRSDLVEIPAS